MTSDPLSTPAPSPSLPAVSALILLAALASAGRAWGCGVAFRENRGNDTARVHPARVDAAISHRNGVQRMIVALTAAPARAERLLWVFALPAEASRVRVEPLDAFLRFYGHDPCWGGRAWIHAFLLVSRATQIYPMLFERLFLPDPGPSLRSHSNRFRGSRADVHAEAVAADSAAALVDASAARGFHLPADAFAPLEAQFASAPSRTFVVAVAEPPARSLAHKAELPRGHQDADASRVCLFVEFPTGRATCPLPVQAGHGVSLRDFTIYVMGYVKPQCASELAGDWEVLYRFQSRFGPDAPDAFRRGLPPERIPCTVIRAASSGSYRGSEIRLTPTRPIGIAYAEFVESLSFHIGLEWLVRILLILCFSYLSAGIAGMVLFGEWRGYAAFGLMNLLTIVGLTVAARCRYARPDRDRPGARFASRASAMRFCALFSLVFVALTVLAGFVLLLPLRT